MKNIFTYAVLAMLIFALSCETKEKLVIEQETDENELVGSSASSATVQIDTSILGTWKCIAFGNDETGKERPIKPANCKKCYILTFKKDGNFKGHSLFNVFEGHYNLDEKQLKFANIGGTKVGEMGDAFIFYENLSNIDFYQIKENKLFLYYSKTEYFLFKSQTN